MVILMGQYECEICGYIYDEDEEGTLWKDLPADWACPECGATKEDFIKL